MTRRFLVFGAAVLVVTGCVGATPRAEFEEEVRERGGGITGEQFAEIAEVTAVEVAVTDPADLEIVVMRADAVSRVTVVQARRGDQPDFADTLTFRSGDLLSVEPIQDAASLDLEATAFVAADLPLDIAEQLVDEAILEFGDPDTLVSSLTAQRRAGQPVVVVAVESPRRSGEVVFDAGGSIVESGT